MPTKTQVTIGHAERAVLGGLALHVLPNRVK
jgi:hypothetical protein